MAILYILVQLFGTDNYVWQAACLSTKDRPYFGYHLYSTSRARSANAKQPNGGRSLTVAAARGAEGCRVAFLEVVARRRLKKGCFFLAFSFLYV